MNEHRRYKRRTVPQAVEVVDTMTERVVGRIGNLSAGGMMLIGTIPFTEEALYQLRFTLPDGRGRLRPIQVGAQMLWSDSGSGSGQIWTGFRFITILTRDAGFLRIWADATEVGDPA